nr:hypothetical protein [Sedimentitalea sp. CY04]
MASWGWKATADSVLANSAFDPSRTAVSIVIAQSGPLCSQKATVTYFLVELISIFLDLIGVQYDILGFTTVDRNGGKSRQQWVNAGCPENPGRLSDIKRIVFQEASSDKSGTSFDSQVILRGETFNDSIDGEALFWAAERLKDLSADTNLVLMISDGEPTDTTSLQENHPDFLLSHLKAVIRDLQTTPGFFVAGIGIDRDVSDLYETNLKICELDQIPEDTLPFLTGLFS